MHVKTVFVELPPFERLRKNYFDDDAFQGLQRLLMLNPEAGDLIRGTGGLQKLRFGDERREKVNVRSEGDLLLVGRRLAVLAVYGFRQG